MSSVGGVSLLNGVVYGMVCKAVSFPQGGDDGRPESEQEEATDHPEVESEGDEGEEEWEKEACELYQWTQQLSFDDIR